jgi:hypothetical protein
MPLKEISSKKTVWWNTPSNRKNIFTYNSIKKYYTKIQKFNIKKKVTIHFMMYLKQPTLTSKDKKQ